MIAGVPMPSASSVPIHWSVGSGIASPLDVANTVVAASEPRLPTMRTVVVILPAVGFVNTSTVRAKSSLPVPGTVISRETYSPAMVTVGVTTVRSPSARKSAAIVGA